MGEEPRRPGDRVIRRRVHATRTIDLPEPERPSRPPNMLFHARVLVAAFALTIGLGTMLLALPWVTRGGESTPLIDALFTAVSALSVTGLVTLDTQTHWNWFGQLIILILIQIGGLGFMVGASLVLRMLGQSGTRLRHQLLIQDNMPTMSLREAMSLVRRITRFTFIAEGIGAILLTARFAADMPFERALWHGIFHAVSAFCNAGFDLQGNFASFIGYRDSVWVSGVMIGLIQLGALSYIAFSDIFEKRQWRTLAANTKIILIANAALIAIAGTAFLFAEWNGALATSEPWTRPMQALFQSVSARTAGFATVDFSTVSTFTDFLWVAVMFIGGASGSTAGGIKLATATVVLLAVYSEVRGRADVDFFNRRIPMRLVTRSLAVVSLFFLFHFLMTLALTATEHLYGTRPSFVKLLFETMSAQATVGLSAGLTPEISTPGKLILVLTMFVGRLGPLTLVYALQQRERRRRYRFPEATVHIG